MNIEHELHALHKNLLADTSLRFVSLKQIGGLNSLLRMGLKSKSRETRLAVLNAWAGDAMRKITGETSFTTSKCLTASAASFLINLLLIPNSTPWRLSKYGEELIRLTEDRVERKQL